MRWTCSTRREILKKSWSENLKGRYHSNDLGIDGRIILEWVRLGYNSCDRKFRRFLSCTSLLPTYNFHYFISQHSSFFSPIRQFSPIYNVKVLRGRLMTKIYWTIPNLKYICKRWVSQAVIFCVVAPCSIVVEYQCFGGSYWPLFSGWEPEDHEWILIALKIGLSLTSSLYVRISGFHVGFEFSNQFRIWGNLLPSPWSIVSFSSLKTPVTGKYGR